MSSQAQPSGADFDLDEDLFDFARVAREPELSTSDDDLDRVFASLHDSIVEEELLLGFASAPTAPAAPAEAQPALHAPLEPPSNRDDDRLPASLAPRAPSAPRREPARQASVPADETADDAAAPAFAADSVLPEPPPLVPARPRAPTSTRTLVVVALAVTALNSAVAVTLLRGRADGAGHAEDGAARAAAPEPHAPPSEPALPDLAPATATTHPALETARTEIARGDYAAARQRVYGLLAIIDRLEEPRRSTLEADCQYLVAQTLHLEALARMGGGE